MSQSAMNKPLHTWLRLFRAPNLFTVPGDPLAGWVLASAGALSGRAFLAAGASLLFYMGGLLLNDLCDLEEDRRDRPGRPLPSAAVGKRTVMAVGVFCAMLGLTLCGLAGGAAVQAGLCLIICAVTYNGGLKKLPFVGAVNMGLCRGFSVLVGGAAASGSLFQNAAMPGALIITLYIAAVTNLARNEMSERRVSLERWLPCIALLAGGALLGYPPPFSAATFFAACIAAGWLANSLRKPAVPLPPAIGAFIRILLPIQAAFCASAQGGMVLAVALLTLWPVSRAVGRRFEGS